jgi:hypothetical protein
VDVGVWTGEWLGKNSRWLSCFFLINLKINLKQKTKTNKTKQTKPRKTNKNKQTKTNKQTSNSEKKQS